MRTLLIPAYAKTKVKLPFKLIKLFSNKKVALTSSIQYFPQLKNIQKLIPNSIVAGQVIGCNTSNCIKLKNQVDCFLFIGSGQFHSIEIALKTFLPVFMYNPETNKFSELSKEEIKKIKARKKAYYIKFLKAKKVGILISLKPGQDFTKMALFFQKKLKDKETYLFLANLIDEREFENFSDIDFWINTACSRIETKNVLHFSEIEKFNKDGEI